MSISYFHQERRRDVILLLCCILFLSFQQHVLSFVPSSRTHRRLFHPTIGSNCVRLHAAVKAAAAGGDKIRVRLLADVKATGRKGEIIVVSAAQFTNVLSPKKLAERVSDDKMNEILEKKKAESSAELNNAVALQEKVTTTHSHPIRSPLACLLLLLLLLLIIILLLLLLLIHVSLPPFPPLTPHSLFLPALYS